jgi:catechol 2,3-dioxygenase-like lactoylglutathione lyase family enzyme
MTLLAGMHHVTTLTADMDRLIAFYERVFDAPVVLDMAEEGLRHAFIPLGPGTLLHPFQIPGVDVPQGELPMFERGRIDHIALTAIDEDAFWEVRRRVIAEGAGTGEVTDFGPHYGLSFLDPDGLWVEVVWIKPGAPFDATSTRANWRTVVPPESPS